MFSSASPGVEAIRSRMVFVTRGLKFPVVRACSARTVVPWATTE